jgi:hypothetical protein
LISQCESQFSRRNANPWRAKGSAVESDCVKWKDFYPLPKRRRNFCVSPRRPSFRHTRWVVLFTPQKASRRVVQTRPMAHAKLLTTCVSALARRHSSIDSRPGGASLRKSAFTKRVRSSIVASAFFGGKNDGGKERIATLVDTKISEHTVIVWSKSYCPFGVKAKAALDAMEVDYLARGRCPTCSSTESTWAGATTRWRKLRPGSCKHG